MRKFLLAAILAVCCAAAFGQGKYYTKRNRLDDFQTRTTRIVLTGQDMFDAIIKEEVASRWMLSPYEFCTVQQYLADKLSNLYYFVRFAFDEDFTYMVVTKSGDPEDSDQLKQGFDVVMLPIAPAQMSMGDELLYFPAYIDILQYYLEQAQLSEKVAYRGLKAICSKPVGVIYSDPDQAAAAFASGEKYANVKVVIPSSSGRKTCELVFTTDTHQLRSIRKK